MSNMLLVNAAGPSRIIGLIKGWQEVLKTYVEVVKEGTMRLKLLATSAVKASN